MKNKTYKPYKLYITLGIFVFLGCYYMLFTDAHLNLKTTIAIAVAVLSLFLLISFGFYIKATDEHIELRQSLEDCKTSGLRLKNTWLCIFKKTIIQIEDIASVRVCHSKGKSQVEIYLKNDRFVFFSIIGYFQSKEIIKLFQNLQMEIREKETGKTGDGSVSDEND